MLCCALFVGTSAWAKTEDGEAAAKSEPVSANEEELLNKILSKLPKVSGYIQTGYNYGDKNGDNRSSFQLKRMRVLLDKKISNTFDFRAQFECFSGSTDGGAYKKKVITVMDAFVSAHINKAINFRAGQYYLPLGFENYDISPATLETVDFSNICYRMVCRNAISSADLIDYGRDLGVMAYGDLLQNQEKGFSYLSYNLSLTNGYLPTLNDDNRCKDFVGRLTFRPVKQLSIMGSYNYREYQGNEANVEEDGFYALAAYRFGKFLPVVRYDMYRDKTNKTSANNRDAYLVGCTYELIKNLKFQVNYIHSIYTDKVKDAGTRTGNGNSLQIMLLAKF